MKLICAIILVATLLPNVARADSPVRITLVRDSSAISYSELKSITKIVRAYVPLVAQAWGKSVISVNYSATPIQGNWNVYISDKYRQGNVSGYHNVFDSAVAYISPMNAGLPNTCSGVHSKALWGNTRTKHPGLVAKITREIAEMIVDPYLNYRIGRTLIEICKPLNNSYFVLDKAVVADFALPSLYITNGIPPLSYAHAQGLTAGSFNE